MVPKAPFICLTDGKLNKIKTKKEKRKNNKKGLKNKLKRRKKCIKKMNEFKFYSSKVKYWLVELFCRFTSVKVVGNRFSLPVA